MKTKKGRDFRTDSVGLGADDLTHDESKVKTGKGRDFRTERCCWVGCDVGEREILTRNCQ